MLVQAVGAAGQVLDSCSSVCPSLGSSKCSQGCLCKAGLVRGVEMEHFFN